jgi:hypothetical protein
MKGHLRLSWFCFVVVFAMMNIAMASGEDSALPSLLASPPNCKCGLHCQPVTDGGKVQSLQ